MEVILSYAALPRLQNSNQCLDDTVERQPWLHFAVDKSLSHQLHNKAVQDRSGAIVKNIVSPAETLRG